MNIEFITFTPKQTQLSVSEMENDKLYIIDIELHGLGTVDIICGGSAQPGNHVTQLAEGFYTFQLRAADVETYSGFIVNHTGIISIEDVAIYPCALVNPLAEVVKEE